MPTMKVRVEGMQRLERIPAGLERARRRMMDLTVERLVDSVRAKAPGSPGGTVGRDVVGVVVSETRGEINVGEIGKAHQGGAYIRSKRGPGTAIKTSQGRFIRFPRGARLPATKFITKGLRRRRSIMQQAFDEAYGEIL